MRILGIIPARKGSKRVPGKNTKLLYGKPLIEYALQSSAASRLLTQVVVSSDDDDVKQIVKTYPAIQFVERPEEIATDTAMAITYVTHSLSVVEGNFDLVVIIQATTPFATGADIDATISLLLNDPSADSAVSVMQIQQLYHPYKLKTMQGNKLQPYLMEEKGIMPAQDLPDVYVRNGAVYATHRSVIETGEIIGPNCLGYVMPFERSVDINYPIDFEFAEFLAARNNL